MLKLRIGGRPYAYTAETRARFIFSIVAVVSTLALMGWGAFVTSINAGLAVPDWPTTFQSYDPFNPWPEWWRITPVLAEHGHRLLGMLVGLLMIVMAVWTGWKDPRRWMKVLGVAALILVIFQGVLGGLRVVWVSLDLAMVHAAFAQIFFSLIVAMTLFTSRGWMEADGILEEGASTRWLRTLAAIAALGIFFQIVLGVFLRHPGTGLDPLWAGLHIAGAVIVAILMTLAYLQIRRHHADNRLISKAGNWMLGGLIAQLTLGFTAYFVILDERGVLQPSNFQVIVNSLHLIVAGLLLASAVSLTLIAARTGSLESVGAEDPHLEAA